MSQVGGTAAAAHRTPLVSIIINNFNYAGFLPRSIESALEQTYAPIEVIVVDDASTDGSRAVIRRYGQRVLAVLQERNGGQGAAINAGFRASRGEIIMLLDADDYLYPDAAERVVSAWVPGHSKVHYRLDLVDASGRKIDVYPPPEVRLDAGDVVPFLLRRGRYETTVTSGNAFGRQALDRVMPVPEAQFRISADGYLVTVAPFHGTVGVIDQPLGAYRLHGGNAWAQSSATAEVLAERMRRSLDHDRLRYGALEAAASSRGLQVREDCWANDYQHLEVRLASLRLDRGRHPFPGDRAISLGLKGAKAVMSGRFSLRRRAALALWFLALGSLPTSLAERAARWRLHQGSRPVWADQTLKLVRRLVR